MLKYLMWTKVIRYLFVLFLLSCGSPEKNNIDTITADSTEMNTGFFAESTSLTPTSIEIPELSMEIPVELLTGQLTPAQRDSILVVIPPHEANRAGLQMHKDAYQAFTKMRATALADGVDLIIVSAFRDFNHQKRIWENKWHGRQMLSGNINATSIENEVERAREILKFSSMPGTSRHHWGTDIDLNSLSNSWFTAGEGLKVYNWLQSHASEFGFCQPYTSRESGRLAGYEEEKWHWSYMPVASRYLTAYQSRMYDRLISGFDGAHTAIKLDVVNEYVSGISDDCFQ